MGNHPDRQQEPQKGASIESHMQNNGDWEMLRTDLYMQAQGVLHPDTTTTMGHAWYRADIELGSSAAKGKVHIYFPACSMNAGFTAMVIVAYRPFPVVMVAERLQV